MTAENLDVRPAIAPGIVAPNATNLVLLFALEAKPVSAQSALLVVGQPAGTRSRMDGDRDRGDLALAAEIVESLEAALGRFRKVALARKTSI
jgi:hypothetical protein